MIKPVHGGGVDRAMQELGLPRAAVLDFSASINPLGAPPLVQSALTAALTRIGDYPEIEAASLRTELARFHQLPEANLLPGSGSTELLYLLPRVFRPRRALLLLPCFSEYAPALQRAGCQLDSLCLSAAQDFAFSIEQVLAAVQPETDLVVLANPGNPSGVAIAPEQLLALAEQLGDCRLLVDEAFVDFCPHYSLISQVVHLQNLLVLRSLTKFYAIPGLRVGYLAGANRDITLLMAQKEPWTLSNLAIAAGKACLGADDFRQQTLTKIPQLRAELCQGLESLGIRMFASEANYLLCQLPDSAINALELAAHLWRSGLLIRSCADFTPLDGSFFRVAVASQKANWTLLYALAAILD